MNLDKPIDSTQSESEQVDPAKKEAYRQRSLKVAWLHKQTRRNNKKNRALSAEREREQQMKRQAASVLELRESSQREDDENQQYIFLPPYAIIPLAPVKTPVKSGQDKRENSAQLIQLNRQEQEYIYKHRSRVWCYDTTPGRNQFYEYKVTHWEELSSQELETKLRLWSMNQLEHDPDCKLISTQNASSVYSSLARISRMHQTRDILRIQRQTVKTVEDFHEHKIGTGINFLNAYYDIAKNQLVPHNSVHNNVQNIRPDSFDPFNFESRCPVTLVDSVTACNYNPEAIPNLDVMVQLASMVGYDLESLWKIKVLIYRSLVLDVRLHTGFLLSGPAGTGKSTTLNFLSILIGQKAVIVPPNHLENRFMIGNLRNKNAAFVRECAGIRGGLLDSVKKLQSHDPVKCEIKHVHDTYTFVFYGLLIIATNTPPAEWLSESALKERFFVIEHHKSTLAQDIDFQDKLKENADGLVSWALTLSRLSALGQTYLTLV